LSDESNPTIAFDTWILGSQARNHGIHVYAKQLLGHFRDLAPRYSVEIMPSACSAADNCANQFTAAPGFQPKQSRLLKNSRAWRWGGANLMASLGKADLVFSPAATTLYFGALAPSVATIHDLIPVVVPLGSKRINRILRFFYWSAAKLSHAVITDSNHSKNDLVNLYGIPESKVSVVYLGCDKAAFNNTPQDPELHGALMSRLGVTKPYIVHHGVIKSYKNLKRLIQAYRLAVTRNRNLDLDLVLAGPLGWEYEDILAEANNGAGRRRKVIFAHALSDPDLAMLVKGASLAVIPSLYEGFCLPLVESMACGVPTIAANRSCLPEVSGGILRYFDPESVEEMSACIEEALENETLRRELAVKGHARAQEFDWRRCASETLEILSRIAHEKRK
jgi:glycosyltransferase involved in cell wall biosynthesis